MIFALLGLLLLAATTLPQMWVRGVINRYDHVNYSYPYSGAELARTLLDHHGLSAVRIERVKEGDHYDPRDRSVRLSTRVHDGRTLSAITIAAHEVGHALQHSSGYRPMELRGKIIQRTAGAERIGAMILLAAPVIAILSRRPLPSLVLFLAGLVSMGAPVVAHLITLPVELDASFNRALPLMKSTGYLRPEDEPAAKKLLRAAAWTYVAASLGSLLNFWKWLRVVRGGR